MRKFLLLLLFASPSVGFAECVRSIADGLRLHAESCVRPVPFVVTGRVCVCSRRSVTLVDGAAGAEIIYFDQPLPTLLVRRGDVVRAHGLLTVAPDGTPRFEGVVDNVLRDDPLPSPTPVKGAEITDGSRLFTFVRTRGVITSVIEDEIAPTMAWLTLRTPSAAVTVAARSEWRTYGELRKLLDAEVEIAGFVKPATGWRRNIGPWLLPTEDDALDVIAPPPHDPFAAPPLTDASPAHRQRIQGRVVAASRNRVFLRSPRGRLVAVHPMPGEPRPHVGERATAAGFAELDPFHVRLAEAFVRIDGAEDGQDEAATTVTAEQLFTDGHGNDKVNTARNGQIVRLVGTIASPADAAAADGTVRLTCGTRHVEVDLSGLGGGLPPVPAVGSTVAVTGLCLAEFENVSTVTIFPRFRRFLIVPRRVGDLAVLATPPWWTPARLLALVFALAALIVAAAAWCVLLNVQARRRGNALYDERIAHALAEQKVEERTRLAVELHDSISQMLTGVALQLDGGETAAASRMLGACRGELRRCLWDLRSRSFEERDLTEAIQRTLAPHLSGAEARVRFNVPRERLSETTTHAILRIVRELAVNAIRHGGARHVKVAGEYHAGVISFSVQDDGCGFSPEGAPGPESGHFGLLGVRERIEAFDGTLEAHSAPGEGARFVITLHEDTQTDETENQGTDRR